MCIRDRSVTWASQTVIACSHCWHGQDKTVLSCLVCVCRQYEQAIKVHAYSVCAIHSAGGPVLLLLLDSESEWAVAWGGSYLVHRVHQECQIAVNWGRTEARCWLITDSIWCMGVLLWAWLIAHWMCCSITCEIWTCRRFSRDCLIDRSPSCNASATRLYRRLVLNARENMKNLKICAVYKVVW